MKSNKFFTIILLGVVVFSNTTFGSQQPEEQSIAKRIYNWIWAKRAKENVVKTAAVAATASGLEKLHEYGKGVYAYQPWVGAHSPSALLASSMGFAGLGTIVGASGAIDYWNALFSKDPIGILQGIIQMFTGSVWVGLAESRMAGSEYLSPETADAIIAVLSGAMITGLTVNAAHAIRDYVKSGKTTEEQAVEKYKNILTLAIADPEAFPTIESKIYALNRPTNLGLNVDESDVLLYEAITQIINTLQSDPLFAKIQEIKQDLEKKSGEALQKDPLGLTLIYNKTLQDDIDELKTLSQYQSPEGRNALDQILIDSLINKTRNDERYKERTLDQNLQAFENQSPQYKAFQSIFSCLKKEKVAKTQAQQQ